MSFQLTRPARGATIVFVQRKIVWYISTHTPREGRDLVSFDFLKSTARFQLTRPARGAT